MTWKSRPSHHESEADHDHDDFESLVVAVGEAASARRSLPPGWGPWRGRRACSGSRASPPSRGARFASLSRQSAGGVATYYDRVPCDRARRAPRRHRPCPPRPKEDRGRAEGRTHRRLKPSVAPEGRGEQDEDGEEFEPPQEHGERQDPLGAVGGSRRNCRPVPTTSPRPGPTLARAVIAADIAVRNSSPIAARSAVTMPKTTAKRKDEGHDRDGCRVRNRPPVVGGAEDAIRPDQAQRLDPAHLVEDDEAETP